MRKTCSYNHQSSLWIAACHGHSNVVRKLLKSGADKALGSSGKLPSEVARQRGHYEVANMIEQFDYPLFALNRKCKRVS